MMVDVKKPTVKNKLLRLKKWLKLPEAAKYLSSSLNEEISEADILNFALNGHLNLSIYFIKPAWARYWKHDREIPETFWNEQVSASEDDTETVNYIDPIDRVREINDVWNLSMTGGVSNDIQNKFHQLTDGPDVSLNTDCYIIEDENETTFCLLYERIKESEDCLSKIISSIRGGMWIDNKLDNCIQPFFFLKVGEHVGRVGPHAFGVAFHNIEIGADIGCQINFINHQ